MADRKPTYEELEREIAELRANAQTHSFSGDSVYRTLIENINTGIYMSTLDGKLLHVNSTVVEMSGYDNVEEFLTVPASKLYADPEDRTRIKESLLKDGFCRNVETRSVKKSGEIYWITLSAVLMKDESGNATGILGAVQDITDRKRAEEEIRRLEEYNRAVVSESPIGILLYDASGQCIVANRAMAETIGATVEEALKQNYHNIESWKKSGLYEAALQAIREKRTVVSELAFMSTFGKQLYLHCYLAPLSTGDLVLMGVDYSERKKAEDEADKYRERLEALLGDRTAERNRARIERDNLMQTIPDIIYVLDVAGYLLSWNAALEEITGYTPDEIRKMHGTDFFVDEDKMKVALAIKEVFDMGLSEVEARFLTKNGTAIPYWFSGKRFVDDNGVATGITGVGKDMTALLKAQAEKEALQEQLLQSQKMEVIGSLAGGVAHDFNNILATISGSAEIMLRKLPPDSPLTKNISRIIQSGRRARNLTMKLLTFARKEKLEITTVNLNSMADDIVEMLKGSIAKSIRITTEYDDALPAISADITQITQALLNICLNSCDAMPDGGTLTLKTYTIRENTKRQNAAENGSKRLYCAIEILDTGTGIPEEAAGKIFDPFFTTKEKGKGTGLGLAVTRGIVENHSGTIEAASNPSGGTVVRITLPASEYRDEPAHVNFEQPERPSPSGRILIIDDDKNFLATVAEGLELEGYSVIQASSARAGVDAYRKHSDKIDVIALDMIMPETESAEVFEQLRAINSECKVILCSGFSVEGKATNILNKGARSYIQKPFEISEFATLIHTAIEG